MVTKCGGNRSRACLLACVFILIIILVWVATGCQEESPTSIAAVQPPVISEPKVGAPTPLKPGEEVGISVDVSSVTGISLTYTWHADGGEIVRGQGSPAITYRAPEEPGTYNVRVVVEWDDQSVERATSIKVEEEPTPTSQPPTDTPVPPTDTPVLPTATPVPPTKKPHPTTTAAMPDAVVVAYVNLRSGPGTVYDIISTLSPNQVLTVTGRITDTTWLQVNTDQMQEGWVVNWADLVTLNLPTEEIPIVSTPPPPTGPPTPTQMSFQNFEPDNGTPPGGGNYFWDAWFTTCSFESAIVREGSRTVRVHAHAEADGAGNGGTMGINPSSNEPIDLSSATTISVWVYDTQGSNTVQLRLRDNNDALSNEVWSKTQAEQNNWTEITWSLSDFTGVDLSRIKNIELYEWSDGVYYFDAVSWGFTSTLESIPCSSYQADTDAETIVRLIQAEEQAILNENISIIQAIFAEGATIWDAARDEHWDDPVTRYAALFANTDFVENVHFEIQPVGLGITESAAYFTSGSKGKFVSVDNPSQTYEFANDPGSDHWTFGRNGAGCWVITNFTFNAGHVPFP